MRGGEEVWWSILLKKIPLRTCGHLAVSERSPLHHCQTGLALVDADSMCEDVRACSVKRTVID